MKKNFTKYAGIALVALLTACNGSTITKEEAAEVAEGITTAQLESKDLYDVVHIDMNVTGYEEGKEYKEHTQTWIDGERHFLHVVSEVTNDGKTEKEEAYLGQIDDKYYEIDMVEKTYTEYSKLALFEVVYDAKSFTSGMTLSSYGTGVLLESLVAAASEESEEEALEYEFKSKGDGHLYVDAAGTVKDKKNDSEVKATLKVIFDDNKLKTYETVTKDDKTKENNATIKIDVDGKVNAKMPSLKGLTKSK